MALKERSGGSDHRPVVSASMVNKLKAGRTDLGYCSRFATVLVREKQLFFIISEQIALPIFLLRYVSHGAGSAQGAASRRRPLYPRALAAKIATSWYLRLIPAGFGSGRGSVRAKQALRPHPCGLPRPSGNVSAILRPPTPAVSASAVKTLKAGRKNCRSGKALAATRQKNGTACRPGKA